jgi:UDP-glucose 4-epimerase
MQKRALVTGGAGFIGSHLVDRLVAEGWKVTVIDNLVTGYRPNLAQVEDKITFVEGDITDRDLLATLIKEGDTVFHLAAHNSVPRSIENPWDTNNANVNGTLAILLAAKEKQARRVIYSGSSSAYGNAEVDVKEEGLPPHPISPYGLAKFTGEEYTRLFHEIYGLSTLSLRYFNVFGPRQNPVSPYAAVIPKFIVAMEVNKPITIFGDGEQSRDFTYVENVAEANYLAAIAENPEPGTYNVACGGSITLNRVVEMIEQEADHCFEIDHAPERAADVRSSKASIAKISRVLGYQPLVDFEDGLRKTITWYKDNAEYFV